MNSWKKNIQLVIVKSNTVVTTHSFTIKNINVKITFHIQDRDIGKTYTHACGH